MTLIGCRHLLQVDNRSRLSPQAHSKMVAIVRPVNAPIAFLIAGVDGRMPRGPTMQAQLRQPQTILVQVQLANNYAVIAD
jgi:hypothetical protein